jgi:hypothetical protein
VAIFLYNICCHILTNAAAAYLSESMPIETSSFSPAAFSSFRRASFLASTSFPGSETVSSFYSLFLHLFHCQIIFFALLNADRNDHLLPLGLPLSTHLSYNDSLELRAYLVQAAKV